MKILGLQNLSVGNIRDGWSFVVAANSVASLLIFVMWFLNFLKMCWLGNDRMNLHRLVSVLASESNMGFAITPKAKNN